MVLAEAFNRAVEFHRAGRLKEAEASYREVLNAQPEHFDSLHLLGVIEKQKGNDAEAVRLIEAALKSNRVRLPPSPISGSRCITSGATPRRSPATTRRPRSGPTMPTPGTTGATCSGTSSGTKKR